MEKKMSQSNNTNSLKKKPSFKNKNPPEIRQTYTSMYRMLKANPFLKEEMEKKNKNLVERVSSKLATLKFDVNTNGIVSNTEYKKTTDGIRSQQVNASKKSNANKEESRGRIKERGLKSKQRRSLSAQHYDNKKFQTLAEPTTNYTNFNTQSVENIHNTNHTETNISKISPIKKEKLVVTFKTPLLPQERKGSLVTPKSYHKRFPAVFASTPATNASEDLQRRLNKWLKSRQKPLSTYHHLKCFGISQVDLEENKENVEVVLTRNNSYEDLKIENVDKEKATGLVQELENIDDVVKYALDDLHKLILDGYSIEQCEKWLGLMIHNYQTIDEHSRYWECRAAIEQAHGNISYAVECYRNAIVEGAEVNQVDECLERLLQKFSLLNISSGEFSNSNEDLLNLKKERERIVLDARKAFKSSIIQFAIQERKIKKKEKGMEVVSSPKMVVTPVRRSTRKRWSKYSVTPGIQLCSSLHELDPTIQATLNFQTNKALASRYVD